MSWEDSFKRGEEKFLWPPIKLHSEYKFFMPLPGEVGVRVWEQLDGKFTGDCEYAVQNPEQAGPYSSSHPQKTPEEALNDAVQGFFFFLKEPYEDVKFVNRWKTKT